jgi:hypothetical protein
MRKTTAGVLGREVPNSNMTTLETAICIAERSATETRLPQTVFMDACSHGWDHRDNGNPRLFRAGARVHLTMLPARWFEPQPEPIDL